MLGLLLGERGSGARFTLSIRMSDTSFRLAEKAHYNILKGRDGLRAGWRLLIFVAMLVPLYFGTGVVIDSAERKLHVRMFSPTDELIVMAVLLAALFLATGIMATIEGRSIGDYGLPWRRAFCGQFWQGAAIGFASLTALLFVLRLAGAFSFGSLALRGADIWKYGILWTVAFFLVALMEDFLYRGYLLFTLTTALGFWPAAVVTSLVMGGMHYLNPGGHGLGPFATLLYCLVTCLVIRRTGDLWMALGILATWDWGANFFYGVPSGGQLGQGHLFNATLHGPAWLTGGIYGPEAGWPNVALLVIWGILFSTWLRGVKYPKPQDEVSC
jgi:membrane protease YdiL (CAAX protease family)